MNDITCFGSRSILYLTLHHSPHRERQSPLRPEENPRSGNPERGFGIDLPKRRNRRLEEVGGVSLRRGERQRGGVAGHFFPHGDGGRGALRGRHNGEGDALGEGQGHLGMAALDLDRDDDLRRLHGNAADAEGIGQDHRRRPVLKRDRHRFKTVEAVQRILHGRRREEFPNHGAVAVLAEDVERAVGDAGLQGGGLKAFEHGHVGVSGRAVGDVGHGHGREHGQCEALPFAVRVGRRPPRRFLRGRVIKCGACGQIIPRGEGVAVHRRGHIAPDGERDQFLAVPEGVGVDGGHAVRQRDGRQLRAPGEGTARDDSDPFPERGRGQRRAIPKDIRPH